MRFQPEGQRAASARKAATVLLMMALLPLVASSPTTAADVSPSNSDIGISVNILDREGDKNDEGESKSFRFFEGASIYYSLGRLDKHVKAVVHLSALDFDDSIDFETGFGVGILYKADPQSQFTISLVRGYNLMTDGGSDGWYTIVGFGWNFKSTEAKQNN